MRLLTIQSGYFLMSAIMTLVVLGGGFTLIILDKNPANVSWARELIGMIITLWVPSPVENLREAIKQAHEHDKLTKSKNNIISTNVDTHDIEKDDISHNIEICEDRKE